MDMLLASPRLHRRRLRDPRRPGGVGPLPRTLPCLASWPTSCSLEHCGSNHTTVSRTSS